MTGHRRILAEGDDRIRELLELTRRIAVLGIKPESRAARPAHYVPRYLQSVGYEVLPVPVYYPEVDEILGERVYRSVSEIEGAVDMVNVFRRSEAIPAHLADLLAKRPRAVWFQAGIRNDEAALELAAAGILVVQDFCMMLAHRRLIQ